MRAFSLSLLTAAILTNAASQVEVVPLVPFPNANAIWGSTGQDSRGHIWFGVTADGGDLPSAHLMEYVPDSRRAFDRGNVIDQLKLAGLWKPGEHQAKIHSRILPGADGALYFASMDEEGEKSDGSRMPTWGGHLWRFRIATSKWEHLARTPEALIGLARGGAFIYALGYFDHVLYQFDTRTSRLAHATVGSVEGHVSRNFAADGRGHAFVPKVSRTPGAAARVSLVELGTDLKVLGETPIDSAQYFDDSPRPSDSHGITGIQEMKDGSIFISTHMGRLFHIVPPPASAPATATAQVINAGWMHPAGPRYVASLFTADGTTTLFGVSRPGPFGPGAEGYQWLTCETAPLACKTSALTVDGESTVMGRALLYGSATRDAAGGHYVVGSIPKDTSFAPWVLRVQPAR